MGDGYAFTSSRFRRPKLVFGGSAYQQQVMPVSPNFTGAQSHPSTSAYSPRGAFFSGQRNPAWQPSFSLKTSPPPSFPSSPTSPTSRSAFPTNPSQSCSPASPSSPRPGASSYPSFAPFPCPPSHSSSNPSSPRQFMTKSHLNDPTQYNQGPLPSPPVPDYHQAVHSYYDSQRMKAPLFPMNPYNHHSPQRDQVSLERARLLANRIPSSPKAGKKQFQPTQIGPSYRRFQTGATDWHEKLTLTRTWGYS